MYRLDRGKRKKYLVNADKYFSTLLWEGLSLLVLEVMFIELPVVLYNCVGHKDLIKNNGFYIIIKFKL
jgi:glycosyltransferase involved in cell wall biosynthesis